MWLLCFIEILVFDFLWCLCTTFRGLSDVSTWVGALFFSFLMMLPWMITRRVWVQMVFLLLGNLWMICNLMYCRTYMQHIPLDSYLLVGNLKDFSASVWDSFRWYDSVLPLLTIGFWIAQRHWRKWSSSLSWPVFCLGAGCSGLLMLLLSLWYGGVKQHMTALYNSCYQTNNPTLYYGLISNLIYSCAKDDDNITPQREAAIISWMEDHRTMCPLPALGELEMVNVDNQFKIVDTLGRKSLVLILLESFESWLLLREVQGVEITPTLNSLLHDSTTLYVPNVLTQVGSGRSIEAQLLINAGLLPMNGSVFSMQYDDREYNTLTKALKERSWKENRASHALLFSPDKPYVWNQGPIAHSFGFDSLIMEGNWRDSVRVGSGQGKLTDDALCIQTVEKLQNDNLWPIGDDAFLQIISYSGHNPFVLPDEMKKVHFKDMPQRLNDYMTMANFTDSALIPLLEYIKARPDYDDILVVITGDHEGLASDRKALLNSDIGAKIIDQEQFTPLIVLNSPVAGRYDSVVGQIDIFPTLLQLLSLTSYHWHGIGESIFNPDKAPFAISSMTNRIVGDTTTTESAKVRHLKDARNISDLLIRTNFWP